MNIKLANTEDLTITTKGGNTLTAPDATGTIECSANKVTSLSSSSTDTLYPSAKAVYDAILAADIGGSGDGGSITQVLVDWNQSDTTAVDYIKNKPTLATVATSGSYNDLSNKPTIPAAQVNSDWNATSGVAQILNKPTIPAADEALTNSEIDTAWSNAVVPLINFTIGSSSYQAIDGMTWQLWANDPRYSQSWSVAGENISSGLNTINNISLSDLIIENYSYTIRYSGGGSND